MWLLNFIPDSLIHLLVLGGALGLIASFVLGFIPFINKYKLPAQLAFILVLCFGLYLEGGIANNNIWKAKVAAAQLKISQLETKSAESTVITVNKYIDRVKIVKEKGDVIIKEVPLYITEKSDANCVIPNSFVMLHDSAAKNEVPDPTGTIDESASTTKLSTVTETVVDNYNTYHELAEQLRSLQDWVRTQEKIYNER
jgi:hypothetical protein